MSAIKLIADTFLLCIPDLNFIVHDMNRKLFSNSIITIVSILITPFIFSSCNEENEDNPYPDYPTTSQQTVIMYMPWSGSSIYKDFEDKLFFFPAAVKNHHNYERGLMTHTLSMAQICEFLSSHYKNLNHDLLISGALLHDLGKIIEFNGPVLTKYTNEGKLLGHISIGFSIVRGYCEKLSINKEKAMLLQHMILSHHGKYEFGSPVLPMVKEALVLSMVDDLDAKEELCEQTLVSVKKGEFSPRLFALEDRSIYNPNDD